MALPVADPQFWLVTAAAVGALAFAWRKVARSLRDDAEVPCDKCPKPRAHGASVGPPRGDGTIGS